MIDLPFLSLAFDRWIVQPVRSAKRHRKRQESRVPRFAPPPPEMQQLLGSVQTSQEAIDGFVSVMAGTLPASEFFGPENAERIMVGAPSGAPS